MWRAATHVPPDDPRATGDAHPVAAAARYQNRLDEALRQLDTPAVTEWGASIRRHAPTATDPGDIAFLANRLAAASRAGVEITPLLAKVSAAPALPDDQPAAALWWRITAELGALPETVCVDPHLDDTFRAALAEHLSPVAVNALVTSPSWPSIIDAVDLAQRAGWRITDLVTIADHIDPTESDPGQGLLWRLTTLCAPTPTLTTNPITTRPPTTTNPTRRPSTRPTQRTCPQTSRSPPLTTNPHPPPGTTTTTGRRPRPQTTTRTWPPG